MAVKVEIIYFRDGLVAINKPHGLLVHRSPIANDANDFALQQVSKSLGFHVYPAHRIDRKTAGVLLFTTTRQLNSLVQQAFMERKVEKNYVTIVRGWPDDEGTINYLLKDEQGRLLEAITHYRCLFRSEMPWPSAGFETSRYALVQVNPVTGRMHQIRRHLAHIFHPVLGDVKHGCNKQNRLLRQHIGLNIMLLHALNLCFEHPASGERIFIEAPFQPEFLRFAQMLGFHSMP